MPCKHPAQLKTGRYFDSRTSRPLCASLLRAFLLRQLEARDMRQIYRPAPILQGALRAYCPHGEQTMDSVERVPRIRPTTVGDECAVLEVDGNRSFNLTERVYGFIAIRGRLAGVRL